MGRAINLGRPIVTHGPWMDLSKMFVGFDFSEYATKEDIPRDLRFVDMVVFEKSTGEVKEYHLEGGTGDELFVDKTKVDADNFKAVSENFLAYGSFYAYNKTIPFNIVKANTYHALCLVTAGDFTEGYTNIVAFNEGRIVDANITSEADSSGKLLITCSAAHALSTGDLVVLVNMNNAGHDKPTIITRVDATSFTCDDINYVANAGNSAGIVTVPAYLQPVTNAGGIYFVSLNIDGTAAAANKAWKWEVNKNINAVDAIVSERLSTNTLASLSTSGIIELAENDKLWISAKNITDTTDYVIKNMNFNIHKI